MGVEHSISSLVGNWVGGAHKSFPVDHGDYMDPFEPNDAMSRSSNPTDLNLLMILAIVRQFATAKQFALIRSAGSSGGYVVKCVIEEGCVYVCMDIMSPPSSASSTPLLASTGRYVPASPLGIGIVSHIPAAGGGGFVHPTAVSLVDTDDVHNHHTIVVNCQAHSKSTLPSHPQAYNQPRIIGPNITNPAAAPPMGPIDVRLVGWHPESTETDLLRRGSAVVRSSPQRITFVAPSSSSLCSATRINPATPQGMPQPFEEIHSAFLPERPNLTEIRLDGLCNITHITGSFLTGCVSLTELDMQPLTKLVSVGRGFAQECARLKVVHMALMVNFTHVGESFFQGCKVLKTVNLLCMPNVEKLSPRFLHGCDSIEELSFAACRRITSIPPNFLGGCKNLRLLDLSPLEELRVIPVNCFANCSKLTHITLPAGITKIDRGFAKNCVLLSKTNLDQLTSVTSLAGDVLGCCVGLQQFEVGTLVANVPTVPDSLLSYCTHLKQINLTPFAHVTALGVCFLAGCTAMTSVDLSPLSKVTSIEWGFLEGCTGLTTINLSPFAESLSAPLAGFLRNCSGLRSPLDLTPLRNVPRFDVSFLAGCTSLTEVDCSVLPNMTVLPPNYLRGCTRLKSIKFPPAVTQIGAHFLGECVGLKDDGVNFTELKSVEQIDMFFLIGCTSLKDVNISSMVELAALRIGFLNGCTSLQHLTLPPRIISIGPAVLVNCSSLQSLDLREVSPVSEELLPGDDFLSGCTSLREVYVSKNSLLATLTIPPSIPSATVVVK